MPMTKAEVLTKVKTDGPIGLQYICDVVFDSGEAETDCQNGIIVHLQALKIEGKVEYIKAQPGGLNLWGAV
tara:strand:- start:248 stop:460 length:213 start_codon:yes stop_codon:yes gene_type:complete